MIGNRTGAARFDPRARLVLLLIFIIAVVTTPPGRLAAFIAYAGMTAWASALAGISTSLTMRRAALVLPFSLIAALGVPFTKGGDAIPVLGVGVSVRGLWILAGVAMKSFLSAAMLSVVTSSTGFDRMASSMRSLGVPHLFVDILALSWRYISLLAGEADRLRKASVSRGFRPRWLPQASIVGLLAGSLFTRSIERAERIHGAMVLRGYGALMPASRVPAMRTGDALLALAAASAVMAVRIFLR